MRCRRRREVKEGGERGEVKPGKREADVGRLWYQ